MPDTNRDQKHLNVNKMDQIPPSPSATLSPDNDLMSAETVKTFMIANLVLEMTIDEVRSGSIYRIFRMSIDAIRMLDQTKDSTFLHVS